MKNSLTTSAISFNDTKTAALYFDRVIPIEFKVMRGTSDGIICEIPDTVEIDVLAQLIFGENSPRHRIISYLDDHWSPMMNQIRPLIKDPLPSQHPDAYKELKSLYLSDASAPEIGSVRNTFRKFAKDLGIDSFSVLLPEKADTESFSQAYSCLTTTNLPLVETTNATWEQIMELRSDVDSRKKLRRLRLFFLDNYTDKSHDYIKDDLHQRLDDYESARKKHGFDAVMSSLSILLDANSLQAAAVAGLTTGLFGGPLVGITTGAAVELGKVLIELSKKQAEIRNLSSGHELGYIINAQNKING